MTNPTIQTTQTHYPTVGYVADMLPMPHVDGIAHRTLPTADGCPLHVDGTDWSLRRLAADVVDVTQRVTALMPLAGVHPWTALGVHPRTVWRPWHVYTAAAFGAINNTLLEVPRVALRTWRHVGSFTPAETEMYCHAMRQPRTARATTLYYRNILTREDSHFWRHAKDINLPHPVLHLNGANDPLTRRLSPAYREYAPGMELKELPNCGHFIGEERSEELTHHITDFFWPDR